MRKIARLFSSLLIVLAVYVSGAAAQIIKPTYPIASDVFTTLYETVVPDTPVSGLSPMELSHVSQYSQYGYGNWHYGPGLVSDTRTDIMPSGYNYATAVKKTKLLNFFTITDIHITDKESPSQLIYLQQLTPENAHDHSIYSPIMPYTTQVLDAAVQTINALHKQNPFDFGMSLGDICNSTQYNEQDGISMSLTARSSPRVPALISEPTPSIIRNLTRRQGLIRRSPGIRLSATTIISGSVRSREHVSFGSPASATLSSPWEMSSPNPANINNPEYYMGVLDGSTPDGDIIDAGPVENFSSPPKVAADPDRRSLSRTEWMNEFFTTSSNPVGHGFNLVDPNQEKGFACYSFVPKSNVPLKVIVLDDTQMEADGSTDIHGHGFLDQARWDWLKKELADGDAAGQLMIIAAHIPIGVEPTVLLRWNGGSILKMP